jgi:replicative DNA helicase
MEDKVIASLEIEAAFLGAALLDPLVPPLYLSVPPSVFYLREHSRIWEAILVLVREGKSVNLTSVRAACSDLGYQDVGTTIVSIMDTTIGSYAHADYMELILDKAVRRHVQEYGPALLNKAADTKNSDWKQQVQAEFSKLFEQLPEQSGFLHASEYFDKATSHVESISTGIPDLDNHWGGGFARGNLIPICGRPGMGKSAFACWLSLGMAHRGSAVAFASVEMSAEEVLHRWMGIMLRTDYQEIRHRGCANDPQIASVRQSIQEKPLYIDDRSLTADAIIGRTIALSTQVNLGCLVIDHFHRIFPGSDPATVDAANKAVRNFKNLARQLNIPVLLLCQLNRGVESRENKRPNASDVRQFSNIEQEADLMVGLYRDEHYNKETIDRNITEVITLKNRHGQGSGSVKLLTDIGKCLYTALPKASF